MDVRRLDGVTRLEGALHHAPGLEVADLDAVEGLTLARFNKLIFDNGVRVAVQHDLDAAAELVGVVSRHVIYSSDGVAKRPIIPTTLPFSVPDIARERRLETGTPGGLYPTRGPAPEPGTGPPPRRPGRRAPVPLSGPPEFRPAHDPGRPGRPPAAPGAAPRRRTRGAPRLLHGPGGRCPVPARHRPAAEIPGPRPAAGHRGLRPALPLLLPTPFPLRPGHPGP